MTEKLDQKLAKRQAAAPAPDQDGGTKQRNSVKVDAKIDAYIAADPGYLDYVKGLPRERLERIAVLHQVEKIEKEQRIQQSSERKITDWLASRPDIAKEIDEKIASLQKDDQPRARIWHGRQAAEREGLKTGPKI